MPIKLKSIIDLLIHIRAKTRGEVIVYPVRAKDMTNKSVIKAFHNAGVNKLPALISRRTGVVYEGCNNIKSVIADLLRPTAPKKPNRQFEDLDSDGLDYMDKVMLKRSIKTGRREAAAKSPATRRANTRSRYQSSEQSDDASTVAAFSIADSTAYNDDLDEHFGNV